MVRGEAVTAPRLAGLAEAGAAFALGALAGRAERLDPTPRVVAGGFGEAEAAGYQVGYARAVEDVLELLRELAFELAGLVLER